MCDYFRAKVYELLQFYTNFIFRLFYLFEGFSLLLFIDVCSNWIRVALFQSWLQQYLYLFNLLSLVSLIHYSAVISCQSPC